MRKYYFTSGIFDHETAETLYWAGFLAADGNVSDRNTITLSLKSGDALHVEKFQRFLSTASPVKRYKKSAILRITSKELSKSLSVFNIVPRKNLKNFQYNSEVFTLTRLHTLYRFMPFIFLIYISNILQK